MKKQLSMLAVVILLPFCLFPLDNISFLQLTNGLRVIVSPLPGHQTVSVMTVHLNSVKDEPLDIKGTTYILKRLVEVCGSRNLDPGERYRHVKRNGGEYTFDVRQDYSILYQLAPPALLENTIWFEKERLESLDIPDSFIESRKNRITRELRDMLIRNTRMRAIEWIHRQHFQNTRYEYPVYGDIDQVTGIPNNKIKRFYLTLTQPQNTVLIICGNTSLEQLTPILKKYFGEIQSRTIPRSSGYIFNQVASPPEDIAITEEWVLENGKGPMLFYGFIAPPKFHSDYIIYSFLLYYLLDPRISRLNRLFNIQNNINADIFKNFSDHVGINSLTIGFETRNRLDIEKIKFGMTELMTFLQTSKLSYNEINNTKTLMKIDFLKKLQDLRQRSELIAEHYYIYRNLDIKEFFQRKLNGITPFSIIRVAKNYFSEKVTKLNVYQK